MNETQTRYDLTEPALQEADWVTVEGSCLHLEFPVFNYRFKGRKRSAKSILENYLYKSRNWQIGLEDDVICSKNLWRAFGELPEKINLDPKENFEILDREYALFIDFVVATAKNTSEEFRKNFGDNKALLLLFLIALNPEISAKEASKKIGLATGLLKIIYLN